MQKPEIEPAAFPQAQLSTAAAHAAGAMTKGPQLSPLPASGRRQQHGSMSAVS